MKTIYVLAVTALVLCSSGCMSDRTKNMANTCQDLLDQGDQTGLRTFIKDAEKQLASLNAPPNKLSAALRDIQDHDALTYKPALEQCLWQLKSRQP